MRTINSLYIHIPFCNNICSYCDFPKLQFFRSIAVKYLEALKKEIEQQVDNKDLKTIYIGGGTPTSLDDDLFLQLLEIIKPYSTTVEEYTIEVNPESLSLNKLKMMKKYGINRISLGVQSTDDQILKLLNRHHDFLTVKNCVKQILEVGINNFNVDLILGLPHVSKQMLIKDLDNILSLKPKHISTYSLSVHEHTIFGINKVDEPDEYFAYDLYKTVDEILTKRGYKHYEVSNFASQGYESKHNLVYWQNEEYYGVGLAAASYINGVRYKNSDNLEKYLAGDYSKEVEKLDLNDIFEYQVMLNLRTTYGLDIKKCLLLFNKDIYKDKKIEIEQYIKGGYLVLKNDNLIPTFDGMMILDRIILDLLS